MIFRVEIIKISNMGHPLVAPSRTVKLIHPSLSRNIF